MGRGYFVFLRHRGSIVADALLLPSLADREVSIGFSLSLFRPADDPRQRSMGYSTKHRIS